MSDAMKV